MIGPPFFNKRYMNGPIFLDSYVKGPIFLTSWYMHIFFAQRLLEAAYPLGIIWIDYDICVITSKKLVQKIKGQHMNRSRFWMIKYMNGSVFSKARYMNGVGFEILARTPVPKLPLNYPRPETFFIQFSLTLKLPISTIVVICLWFWNSFLQTVHNILHLKESQKKKSMSIIKYSQEIFLVSWVWGYFTILYPINFENSCPQCSN